MVRKQMRRILAIALSASFLITPDLALAKDGFPLSESPTAFISLFASQALIPRMVVGHQVGRDQVASRISSTLGASRRHFAALKRGFVNSALLFVLAACGLAPKPSNAPKISPIAGPDRYSGYQAILGLAAKSDSLWHVPDTTTLNLYTGLPAAILNNNRDVVGSFLEHQTAYAELLAAAAADRTLIFESDRRASARAGIGNGSPEAHFKDMVGHFGETIASPTERVQVPTSDKSFWGRLAGALLNLRVTSKVPVERTLLQGARAEAVVRGKRFEIDGVFQDRYRQAISYVGQIASLNLEIERLRFELRLLASADSTLVRSFALANKVEEADRTHQQTVQQTSAILQELPNLQNRVKETTGKLRALLAWMPDQVQGSFEPALATYSAAELRGFSRQWPDTAATPIPFADSKPFFSALQKRLRSVRNPAIQRSLQAKADPLELASLEQAMQVVFPRTRLKTPQALTVGNKAGILIAPLDSLSIPLAEDAQLAKSPLEESLESSIAVLETAQKLLELEKNPNYEVGLHLALGVAPVLTQILGYKFDIPLERSKTTIQIEQTKLMIARAKERLSSERILWRRDYMAWVGKRDAALDGLRATLGTLATDQGLFIDQVRATGINVNPYPSLIRTYNSRFRVQEVAIDAWVALQQAQMYLPANQALLRTEVSHQLARVMARAMAAGQAVQDSLSKPKQPAPAPKPAAQPTSPSVAKMLLNRTLPVLGLLMLSPAKAFAFSFRNGPSGLKQAITERGDTLSELAIHLLRSEGHKGPLGNLVAERVAQIAQDNHIPNIDLIRVGQIIKLESMDPVAAAATPLAEVPMVPVSTLSVPDTIADPLVGQQNSVNAWERLWDALNQGLSDVSGWVAANPTFVAVTLILAGGALLFAFRKSLVRWWMAHAASRPSAARRPAGPSIWRAMGMFTLLLTGSFAAMAFRSVSTTAVSVRGWGGDALDYLSNVWGRAVMGISAVVVAALAYKWVSKNWLRSRRPPPRPKLQHNGPSPWRLVWVALAVIVLGTSVWGLSRSSRGNDPTQTIVSGHGVGQSPLRYPITYTAPFAEKGTVVKIHPKTQIHSGDLLVGWEPLPNEIMSDLQDLNRQWAQAGMNDPLVSPTALRSAAEGVRGLQNAYIVIRGDESEGSIDRRILEEITQSRALLRAVSRLHRQWIQMRRYVLASAPKPLELERQEIWLRYHGRRITQLLEQRRLRDEMRATKNVNVVASGANGEGLTILEGSSVSSDKSVSLFTAESPEQLVLSLRLPVEKALSLSNQWWAGTTADLVFRVRANDSLPTEKAEPQDWRIPLSNVAEISVNNFEQDLGGSANEVTPKMRTNLAIGNNRTVTVYLRMSEWPQAFDPLWLATAGYAGLFPKGSKEEIVEPFGNADIVGILSVQRPSTTSRRYPLLESFLTQERAAASEAAKALQSLAGRAERELEEAPHLDGTYLEIIDGLNNDVTRLEQETATLGVRLETEQNRGILMDKGGDARQGEPVAHSANPGLFNVNPLPYSYPRSGADEPVIALGQSIPVRVQILMAEGSNPLRNYGMQLPGQQGPLRVIQTDHPDPFVHISEVRLEGTLSEAGRRSAPPLLPTSNLIVRMVPVEGGRQASNWARLRKALTGQNKPDAPSGADTQKESNLTYREMTWASVTAMIFPLFLASSVTNHPIWLLFSAVLGTVMAVIGHEFGHYYRALPKFTEGAVDWQRAEGRIQWVHEAAPGDVKAITDDDVRAAGPRASAWMAGSGLLIFIALFNMSDVFAAFFFSGAVASFFYTFADGGLRFGKAPRNEPKAAAVSSKKIAGQTAPLLRESLPTPTSPSATPRVITLRAAGPAVITSRAAATDQPHPSTTEELRRLLKLLKTTMTRHEAFWRPGETDKIPYLTWFQRRFLVSRGRPIRYKPFSILALENHDEGLGLHQARILWSHYKAVSETPIRNQTIFQYKYLLPTVLAFGLYWIFNGVAVSDLLQAMGNSTFVSSTNRIAYPVFSGIIAFVVAWGLIGGGLERIWRLFAVAPHQIRLLLSRLNGVKKAERNFREADEHSAYELLERFHKGEVLDPALASSTAPNAFSEMQEGLVRFAQLWNTAIIATVERDSKLKAQFQRFIVAALWISARQGTPVDAPPGMGAIPMPFYSDFVRSLETIPGETAADFEARLAERQWTDAVARMREFPLPALMAMMQHGLAMLPIDARLYPANGIESDLLEAIQARTKHWRPAVYQGARAFHRFRQMFMLIQKIVAVKTSNESTTEVSRVHDALRMVVNFASPLEVHMWNAFVQGHFTGKAQMLTPPIFTLVRRLFKVSSSTAIGLLSELTPDASRYLEPAHIQTVTETKEPVLTTQSIQLLHGYAVAAQIIRKIGQLSRGKLPFFEQRTIVIDSALMINRRQPSFDLKDIARATLELSDVDEAVGKLKATVESSGAKLVVTNISPTQREFMERISARVHQRLDPTLADRIVFVPINQASSYLNDPSSIVLSSAEPDSWATLQKARGWVLHVPSPFFYHSAVLFAATEISPERVETFFTTMRDRSKQDEELLRDQLNSIETTYDSERGRALDVMRSDLLDKLNRAQLGRMELAELRHMIIHHRDLLHSFGIHTLSAARRPDTYDPELPILRIAEVGGRPMLTGRQDTLFLLPPLPDAPGQQTPDDTDARALMTAA